MRRQWKKQTSYLVGIETQENTSIVITELIREATLPQLYRT